MKQQMSRRDFLKLSLLLSGSASLVSAYSYAQQEGIGSGLQTFPLEREVWSWLRMFEVDNRYFIPSSEKRYLANLENIDVAMPTNGGTLQADGTWLNEPWKVDADWPQRLPHIARDAGQRYIPVVNNDREGFLSVLEDPGLQSRAAQNLVAMATSERFDAPWDGILLDFEGTPPPYRQQLIDFYYLLFDYLKPTGLPVGISVAGRTRNSGTHDFGVIAALADFVDLRCYGYRSPPPKSIGPYWWLERCIAFARAHGIERERLLLGVGNFSKYWPDSNQYDFIEVTYNTALEIIGRNGAEIEWIGENIYGPVREYYAKLGDGHIWVHAAETYRHGLQLIDRYGLRGVSHFAAGMGDLHHWHEIGAWRHRWFLFKWMLSLKQLLNR